jgi:hypothetical protein
MAQKQKRIPKELINAVGREQATHIMNQVRDLEAGKIKHFSVTVEGGENLDNARSAIGGLSNKISVGKEHIIADYEESGRYTIVVSAKPKALGATQWEKSVEGKGEFGAPREGPAAPVHETIGAKLSGMDMSRELANTLAFMMPSLHEHAEKVAGGKPSTITLQFDTKNEAKEARKVLAESGMLGKASRQGDVVRLDYSPPKTVRGRFKTEINASYM